MNYLPMRPSSAASSIDSNTNLITALDGDANNKNYPNIFSTNINGQDDANEYW